MMAKRNSDSRREKGARGAARRAGAVATIGEKPARKNHYLYQSKLDMAKEILGTKTETEALDAALDLVIYGEAIARGTEAMGEEEYHDLLDISAELPHRAAAE